LGVAWPFSVAVPDVREVAAFVVTAGAKAGVVNCSTAPNDVPTEF
jgi:hypothetical protein